MNLKHNYTLTYKTLTQYNIINHENEKSFDGYDILSIISICNNKPWYSVA